MRLTARSVLLAGAATLVVAACNGESEPAATGGAGTDLEAGMGQLEAQVEELSARMDDVQLDDLESRLGDLESQVDLLADAVEEMQVPQNLGGATGDPEASPEAASVPPVEVSPAPSPEVIVEESGG